MVKRVKLRTENTTATAKRNEIKKTPKPIISICAHEKRRFHDSGWCPGPTETRQYYLPRASGFPNEHRARVKVKAHIIDIYLEVVMMLFCDVFIFSHFYFYKFGMLWHLVACLVLGRWCCGLPWSLTAANDLMDSQSGLLMTPKAVCLRSSPGAHKSNGCASCIGRANHRSSAGHGFEVIIGSGPGSNPTWDPLCGKRRPADKLAGSPGLCRSLAYIYSLRMMRWLFCDHSYGGSVLWGYLIPTAGRWFIQQNRIVPFRMQFSF